MQPPHACHWWSRRCEDDLMHEPGPGLQVQMRALSRSEPDWRRILEGHPGSTDGSIGPVPKLGVSRPNLVQLNLAPGQHPGLSGCQRSAPKQCERHAHQERCSVSARHTVHDAVPMPQSAGNDAKTSKETTSSRAPCRVTPFLASGAWPKAETCKATCP